MPNDVPKCWLRAQASALPVATRLPRRAFLWLMGLVVVGAMAGCRQPLPEAVEKATATPGAATVGQGGTLIVGMAATSIVTLDPAAYSDRATETVIRNIFDGLVTRTTDNQIVKLRNVRNGKGELE